MIFEYTSFSLSVNFRTVWDLYSWPYLTSFSERALRVQICGRYNNRSSQLTALLRGDSLKIPALPTPRCTMITITLTTPSCTLLQTKNIECQSPKIQKKQKVKPESAKCALIVFVLQRLKAFLLENNGPRSVLRIHHHSCRQQ